MRLQKAWILMGAGGAISLSYAAYCIFGAPGTTLQAGTAQLPTRVAAIPAAAPPSPPTSRMPVGKGEEREPAVVARPARDVQTRSVSNDAGQTLVPEPVGTEGFAPYLQTLVQGGEVWQLKTAVRIFAECRQAWQELQTAYGANPAKIEPENRNYLLKTGEANYRACQTIPQTLWSQEGELFRRLIDQGELGEAVGYLNLMLQENHLADQAEMRRVRELVYSEARAGNHAAIRMIADGDAANPVVLPLEQRAMWWVLKERLVENAYGSKAATIEVFDRRFHKRWPQFGAADDQLAEARAKELLAGMPPLHGSK